MKKHIFLTLLFLLITTDASYAKNIFFSVGSSFKNYKYEIDSKIGEKTYFSESLPSIKYTVGYITSGRASIGFTGDNIINSSNVTTVNPIFSKNTTAKLKRDDYALFATYPINNETTLLAGYRNGTTSVSYKAGSSQEKDKIKTYGPYIGIKRNIFKTANDEVSISLFYNSLSTDFSMKTKEGSFKFNFDGKGIGAQLGWFHKLKNNNYLLLSTEMHYYDHNKMKNSNISVEQFTIKETAYSARVEYIHVF